MGTKTARETCGGRPVRTKARRVVVQLEVQTEAPLSDLRVATRWDALVGNRSVIVLEARANVIRAKPVKRAAGRR